MPLERLPPEGEERESVLSLSLDCIPLSSDQQPLPDGESQPFLSAPNRKVSNECTEDSCGVQPYSDVPNQNPPRLCPNCQAFNSAAGQKSTLDERPKESLEVPVLQYMIPKGGQDANPEGGKVALPSCATHLSLVDFKTEDEPMVVKPASGKDSFLNIPSTEIRRSTSLKIYRTLSGNYFATNSKYASPYLSESKLKKELLPLSLACNFGKSEGTKKLPSNGGPTENGGTAHNGDNSGAGQSIDSSALNTSKGEPSSLESSSNLNEVAATIVNEFAALL